MRDMRDMRDVHSIPCLMRKLESARGSCSQRRGEANKTLDNGSLTMVTILLLTCTKAFKRVLFAEKRTYNPTCPTVKSTTRNEKRKRLSSPSCQSRDILRHRPGGGLVGSRIRQVRCRYSFL